MYKFLQASKDNPLSINRSSRRCMIAKGYILAIKDPVAYYIPPECIQ